MALVFVFAALAFGQQPVRVDASTHRIAGDPPKLILALGDTSTDTYQHEAVSHALATIERAGLASKLFDTLIRTDTQLVTKGAIQLATGTLTYYRNLNDFDAVILFTSGSPPLTPQQKSDLLAFVREGKGLVVIHSGLGAWPDWPEFAAMIGGRIAERTADVRDRPLTVRVPGFPGMTALKALPQIRDNFSPVTLRHTGGVRVLATSDGVPVVWTKTYGKGRVFASQIGHEDATWDDPAVRTMYREAIRWAVEAVPPFPPVIR